MYLRACMSTCVCECVRAKDILRVRVSACVYVFVSSVTNRGEAFDNRMA